jgi:hypothetical protein
MHLSCTDAYSISKQTKTRFHMTLITKEFVRVHSKRFLSLWYVRRKPCTYHESRLALSPNGLKRASIWVSSPRSTIGCVQNDFSSIWYVPRKPCTNLASWLALSPTYRNELPLEPHHLRVPSGASKTISEPMVRLVQNVHLSSSDTNTMSERIEIRFQMSHVTLEFYRVHPK